MSAEAKQAESIVTQVTGVAESALLVPVGAALEVRDRHELGVRLAVHVDELGEHELDAAPVELGAELVRGGSRLDGHGEVI